MADSKAVLSTNKGKAKFFYGYVIVVAAFFVMVITSGTLYSYGVFVKPLIEDFGWSRAATAGAYSMGIFVLGIFFTVTGRMNDRFGPRRVVTLCGIILGLGYFLMSKVNAIWQLYLFYGLVVAIGQSGSLIPMMSTVARWFIKRRGLMTGIVIAGVGVGQIIMPPLATQLISAYGWRTCFIIVGIIALVMLVVLAQVLRRDPSKVGQLPDGVSKVKQETLVLEARGLSREEALHTRQFWMLFATYICYGFLVQGTMVHIVPHATDLGISAVTAAGILSLIGGISVMGRISIGSAGDRIGNKRALILMFILAVITFIWLQFARELWMLYLFAVLFGFAYGGLVALESPLVAELFGLEAHGALLGIIHFGATIGGAASPLLAGRIFDVTGSYQIAFLVVTGFVVLGLILASFLRPPRREVSKG